MLQDLLHPGSTAGFASFWAVHRIESLNAVGYGDIDELSSLRSSRVGNLLKPLTGETYTKINNSGTTIVTECLIDYTKLDPIKNYKISSRLDDGTSIPYIPLGKITEEDTGKITEDGQTKIIE